MSKKRKTYYLEEKVIHKVKSFAQEQSTSENDAFERAVDVYEKMFQRASEYTPIPNDQVPLLLEAVDNLIYNSTRILETLPNNPLNQPVQESIEERIRLLYVIRNNFIENTKK